MNKDKKEKDKQNLSSINFELVKAFSLILLIFLFLFTAFATRIIFTRLEANIDSLLDRSLSLAQDEYEYFYYQGIPVLQLIASTTMEEEYDNFKGDKAENYFFDEKILSALQHQKNFDFWLVINHSGQVVAANVKQDHPMVQDLGVLLRGSWRDGQTITTTELYPMEQVQSLDSGIARRALVQIKDPKTEEAERTSAAMFQIVAVPLISSDNQVLGAMVAGHLLNNDNNIAQKYSSRIPNSFLSISTRPLGIRIVTNLGSNSHISYLGSVQAEELIKTTQEGGRYVGQVKLESSEIHIVASDPLYNLEGQVIGALTVGIPSQGLASLKKDTLNYIVVSALIFFLISLGIASLVATKLSGPLVALSKMAKEISQEETINSKHIDTLNTPPLIKIREVGYLYKCFGKMASSLYQKCVENEKYMEELAQDRAELKLLTDQLQEINQSLENKVNEQTLDLRKAVGELKVLNDLKSKFLANMSHELRTPLNSVIGFSEMLDDELFGQLNVTQKEYVEIIHNSACHLLEIINDILDLSLIEQGRIILSKREVSPAELIHSVETIVRTQAENKDIALKVEMPDDLPDICVDPTRVKQILYNLVANAVKFTPPQGSIIIDARHSEKELIIAVKDTGIGIKTKDQQRIFDEFYQAENTYERKFEGVGLGLPLSKRLAELHNGHIELSSEVNKGTTVTVYLPYPRS